MLGDPGLGHGFEGSTLVREPGIFQVQSAQGGFEMAKGTQGFQDEGMKRGG